MDIAAINSESIKNTNVENYNYPVNEISTSVYYGVHIPDLQVEEKGPINVFQDKSEAMKLVKRYKKARFKSFRCYHEAAEFAICGSEVNHLYESAAKVNTENLPLGEKPIPFKGPKAQDLVKLRKGIESGDLYYVKKVIWENPRYLISSGDTPSILQEGFRYNALHVAAKAKNHEMAELILNTISDIQFIKLLYGDDCHQNAEERSEVLLDLYLNTPDKGLNETPLHFASKFGAAKVVEVFMSFPMCDKTVKNKYGKTPVQVICDRYEDGDNILIKNQIAVLFEDNFFVPVIRSEDRCITPIVGEPFSPKRPPNLKTDPLQPRLEIHAYAGPMNKEGADKFRKLWKTPPRTLIENPSLSNSNNDYFTSPAALKVKDPDKGLERIGRELATKYDVGWKEYWPFLGSFVDLASEEGLEQLEKYLAYRTASNVNFSPLHVVDLDRNNKERNKGENVETLSVNFRKGLYNSFDESILSNECNSFIKSQADFTFVPKIRNEELYSQMQIFQESSPFLCVEKSCEVFAHRFVNVILYMIDSLTEKESSLLETQMKHLELLISSFIEDGRFFKVDFCFLHDRLGFLIAHTLKDVFQNENRNCNICDVLQDRLQNYSKGCDCFSSDDESACYKNAKQKTTTTINEKVMCLLKCVLSYLREDIDSVKFNITTEEESLKAWTNAKPCCCIWQCNFKRKKSLFKKSRNVRIMQELGLILKMDVDSISRRLVFEKETFMDDHLSKQRVENEEVRSSLLIEKEEAEEDEEEEEEVEGKEEEDQYYTPFGSPLHMSSQESSSDEDLFADALLPEKEVFIEGNVPSKTDSAVFNALKFAREHLNPKDYPHVYKWYHAINSYSSRERENWQSPSPAYPTLTSPTSFKMGKHNSSFWIRAASANSSPISS